MFICIGAEHIWPDVSDVGSTIVYLILSTIIIFTFSLGLWQLYTVKSPEDERYSLKQEAGLWLQENAQTELSIAPADLKVMERFPITTYYSGTKERWLTPYTDKITDLIKYARANGIDILVADTYDFKTYRPKLEFLLDEKENHYGLQVLKTFQQPGKKVILYKVTNEQANNALKNALFKK
ncbi:MAG: hypothetical protein H6767_06905 [Candidatus Peribacteria bacterium]|nr:MAG: hypothetical protein H6767_06905 [Candidatus Peribacteria bacterium]